jgi:hypothetical protein
VRLMLGDGRGTHTIQTLPLSCMPLCSLVQFHFIFDKVFSEHQPHRYGIKLRRFGGCLFIHHREADMMSDKLVDTWRSPFYWPGTSQRRNLSSI